MVQHTQDKSDKPEQQTSHSQQHVDKSVDKPEQKAPEQKAQADVDPVITEIDKFEDSDNNKYSYKLKMADPSKRGDAKVVEFESKTKLDLDDVGTRQRIWKEHGSKAK